MKKSLSIQAMFRDLPFYERFGKVREAGFDMVEFSGWTDLDLSRVTEELQKNSLQLASISGIDRHSLIDPDHREDFLEFLSQSIAVAKSFNCRNLIIETGAAGDVKPLAHANHDEFVKASAATRVLGDAAVKAARAGVTLYLKPVRFGDTRTIGLEPIPSSGDVVKMINSPALRLLLDTAQTRVLSGGAEGAIRDFRDIIGYIHVGSDGKSADIDKLPALRQTLDAIRYDGYLGFTYRLASGDPDIERLGRF